MILEHLGALNSMKIVLASGSPRRREILNNVGLVSFTVVKSGFEEDLDKSACDGAAGYAQATAWMKVKDVCEKWNVDERGEMPDVLIGADTVVESRDGEVLEKPANREEARAMLRALSNGESKVHTGVAILAPKVGQKRGGSINVKHLYGKSFSETTKVEFAELTAAEIEAYIDTNEPFDKAGGYGIQGPAGAFIKGIVGDYFNVMGFPIHAFSREMVSMMPSIIEHA